MSLAAGLLAAIQIIALAGALVCWAAVEEAAGSEGNFRRNHVTRRSPIRALKEHHAARQPGMLENFMTNMIHESLSRACKANTSVVDEIVACYKDNEQAMELLTGEPGQKCLGEMHEQHVAGHMETSALKKNAGSELRELICDHWKDFDDVCSCAYTKAVEQANWKGIKLLIKTKVRVGACFVSALGSREEKAAENIVAEMLDKVCVEKGEKLEKIANCLAKHEYYTEAMESEPGGRCFMDTFKRRFEAKDLAFHKDMICNMREKFSEATGCAYQKLSQGISSEELDTLTRGFTDISLCLMQGRS